MERSDRAMDSRIRIVGLLIVLVVFTAGIAGCGPTCGPDPQGCTWNGVWASNDGEGTITYWVFNSDGTHSGYWDQVGISLFMEFSGDWWMDADVVHFAWSAPINIGGIYETMHCIGYGTFEDGAGSGMIDSIYQGSTYTANWAVSAE
jgi:hypothetical protein